MRLWDLDGELLFPKQTIVAYVKNLLHLSDRRVEVRCLVASFPGYHWLKAVTADGQDVDLYSPYSIGGVRRMYIPFVFQKSLGKQPVIRWSADARRTVGCGRIASQPDGNEFWLMTCRSALESYARSGRPRNYKEAETYPSAVRDFISRSLEGSGIHENFRFANHDGSTRIVPFHPIVLNHAIEPENRNARALPDYTKKGGARG